MAEVVFENVAASLTN